MEAQPHISIVSSLYKSEKFLDELLALCKQALDNINCASYEIILVNDGSPDGSLQQAIELKAKYPQLVIIDLSRNFGHHYAFMAGMEHAKGELVFNIDCDLETSPLVLVEFYNKYNSSQCDVVYGYQQKRKGGAGERFFGRRFWKMFNYFSGVTVPENIVTERLMSRDYVQALMKMGDKNIFLAGMMYWVGYKQVGIPVERTQRRDKSTYGLLSKLRLMTEAISSFSARPLKFVFAIGTIQTLLSFLYGFYIILRKVLFPHSILLGYSSIIVIVLFSTGVIIASVGLIGIYVEKIYNQTKNRPGYIVKNYY